MNPWSTRAPVELSNRELHRQGWEHDGVCLKVAVAETRAVSGGQRFCDGTNSRHRRNGDRPDRNPGPTPTLHPVTSAVDELKGQMNWRQGRLNRPWKARRPTQRVQVGLANLWQTAVGGSRSHDRPGARPGLACWFGWSPPPESNRRPHPYHGTTRNRCANRRFPRSRPTVGAKVKRSLNAQLWVLLRTRSALSGPSPSVGP